MYKFRTMINNSHELRKDLESLNDKTNFYLKHNVQGYQRIIIFKKI